MLAIINKKDTSLRNSRKKKRNYFHLSFAIDQNALAKQMDTERGVI